MSLTEGATVPVSTTRSNDQDFASSAAKANGKDEKALPSNPRPAIFAGILVLAIVVLGIGGWSATAPLSSGVIAPGVVVFEGRRQAVQHLEGGIISEIHVREGSQVESGDVLFRLDTTQIQSRVARIRNLLFINEVQSARLMAEVNQADELRFSEALLQDAEQWGWNAILDRERSIFEERRRSLEGQIELLEAKASQFMIEISGLDVQEAAQADQLRILNEELTDLQSLVESNLVPRARVNGLEREEARLRGLNGEIIARRARASEAISEARLQAEQLRQQFRQEVVSSLRDTENEISDLREQLISATDVLTRTEIYAPQSGRAQEVAITTVGSVIQPGQVLLEIAPRNDRLIVEARVAPQDIDSVSVGQEAEVRISALNLRMTPAVFGKVLAVSGDRVVDERAQTEYFLAQIDILPEELEKLGGQRILAGMPTEVVLPTGERTLINYLISPLTDAMRRGLLER